MGDKIHQPLGQDRKPGRKPAGGSKRDWSAPLLVAATLCLVIGGAAWVAVSGAGIVTIETAVRFDLPQATTPDEIAAADPVLPDASSGPVAGTPAAPAPDAALNSLHGRSGAEIATTLGDDGEEINKITPVTRPDGRPVLLTPPGRVGQTPRLAHLPDPAIIQETPLGPLPVRGADDERAFDIYARPWSGARGARVVIIVGGLGLSQTGTQHAIATLPEEITLAFAANGNSLQRWMQEARRAGHEILLQIPFEPFGYPANDPGTGTLTVAAGAQSNLDDLHTAMARITNYTGITNFMGGRFLADSQALEPIMRDLAGRGLMFVDDGTSAQSLTDHFAKTLGIPFAASDMVLDAVQERGSILAKLDDLERIARRNGVAIGVASAFEVSVDAIRTWSEEARARGIEIVSASAVADDPEK
ncbi:divergent polysaccharide deacetylase family protein [Hoeflea sp. YIM 152468]|uniref:divergent polysaccharide deacetylase family protein n=1 Tax=Hoeflea sp. YIM 152468 TaxID=3031759 RepID=UPI0023DBC940|nr:divergent polysaccharide deacetylase family protein [Hoeflea sp. YIM 152468]MDF1609178.1 divergent polysaccharide deacetylase family protein [Hoeflea sp. YIM 152468]